MKSELVDIAVTIHAETQQGDDNAGAILVSDDGDSKNAKWVPKSQVEIDRTASPPIITLPEWLAIEKGFV